MKTAAKVFIIIGMIVGAIGIVPIIVGAIALKKMKNAKSRGEMTGIGVCTLIFCSVLGGIFLLCTNDSDYAPAEAPAQPEYQQFNQQ